MTDCNVLFMEAPYVAILNSDLLMERCSCCFFPAAMPCEKCQQVVYCNDECATADRPLHEVECPCPPASLSPYHRLTARFAIRQYIDNGEVVLTAGFPANVKHRTCKDLLSHYRNLKNDKTRKEWVEALWEVWQQRITDPRLSSLKKGDMLRMYSTLCINTFGIFDSVSVTANGAGATSVDIGTGLYIDSTRFNHSCRPDMFVMFSGNVMSVMKLRTAKDRNRMKEKEFNRLTIDYGVPTSDTHGAYLALTKQRIDSLQSRYYFTCRCVKCSDQKARMLEENAAAFECSKCKQPFVWAGRTIKLRQTCSCSLKRTKVNAVDLFNVKQLDSSWEKVMTEADGKSEPCDVINVCRPLWNAARKYWHRATNLRRGQLSDRMFHAYAQKAAYPRYQTTQEQQAQDLRLALIAGQDMVACYETYIKGEWKLAVFYYQIAGVYLALHQRRETYEWYTKAINVFREHGDSTNESMVLGWRSKLQLEDEQPQTETEEDTSSVIDVSAS